MKEHILVGGFNDFFQFSPRKLGMISNLTNIFQMGRLKLPTSICLREIFSPDC